MHTNESSPSGSAPDVEPVQTDAESAPTDEPGDANSPSETTDEIAPVVRPVSETIGTGSFFGIGCTILAVLFVCVGVAIFMWRQIN